MRIDWLRYPELRKIRTVGACATLFLAAVACEADSADSDAGDPDAATGFTAEAPGIPDSLAEPAPADSIPDSASPAMRADLEARGGTDVIGTVTLTPGAARTAVSVEIHGANSGLPYVAEIVDGTCAASGPVIAELGRITAGEAGDGEFRGDLDPAVLGPERPQRAVRVRGAGDPSAIVACGNLGPGATSETGR